MNELLDCQVVANGSIAIQTPTVLVNGKGVFKLAIDQVVGIVAVRTR